MKRVGTSGLVVLGINLLSGHVSNIFIDVVADATLRKSRPLFDHMFLTGVSPLKVCQLL